MQRKGHVSKQHGSWVLRYRETVIEDGIPVRKKRFKTLARISPEYPTKTSVLHLAKQHLDHANASDLNPEGSMTVVDFIEKHYLAWVKEHKRPSTYKNYKVDEFERHFKDRLGHIRVRDFRTVTAQKLIQAISKDNPSIGHKTLMRLKSFISGVFTHAKREGLIDGPNPVQGVFVPGRAVKFKGETYTIKEVRALLEYVASDKVAFITIAVAAFTGLRLSELRGLTWADVDFDNNRLHVRRTVWRTRIGPTKTESSENFVPLLPILKIFLENYRQHIEGPEDEGNLGQEIKPTDWLFKGERRHTSLNLPNLVRRSIVPLLTRCKVCHRVKHFHDKQDHRFEFDDTIINWRGWHAFRRSLATNLHSLGVKPAVIAAILRHSDISTTMAYYVVPSEVESQEAMEKLQSLLEAGKLK